MGEAGQFGDCLDREVGVAEEAVDFAEADAQHFVLGAALQARLHSALEGAARDTEMVADLPDPDAGKPKTLFQV